MYEKERLKIGFLGFGNMAQAIAKGWLKKGVLSGDRLFASGRNLEKLEKNTLELGIQASSSNQALIQAVDMVILAVKPGQIKDVALEFKEELKEKIVVCVAVGIHWEELSDSLAEGTQHISIFPNTPISIGEGATNVEEKHSLSDESYQVFLELFESISVVTTVVTSQMAVAGVINGCGPAFTALFIEAVADGAVKYGLSRSEAYQLASQTIKGTGQLQLETGEHPGVMKDAVTSPGGTTIKGVAALEENAFRSSVIQAFDAILK
ncbi:MAG: pyrroline-5-carboxylate reductase [Atopococcus tabaci]|uniref:Pyrroline-5-carboxylate reductase n=1 Tax=Atopococcus tabaci TaxID=269774 RepID=A0AA43ZSI1_9LACT|nr:pyrroline-5-carboxylate reductase [Atopococcus tabaci]